MLRPDLLRPHHLDDHVSYRAIPRSTALRNLALFFLSVAGLIGLALWALNARLERIWP
jgi:hypothetical protein